MQGHRLRVDDAVAVVIERNGRIAVPVDDEIGVLDDLPEHLDRRRQRQAQRERPARCDESQRIP